MSASKDQKAIKSMFRDAFDRLGGVDYLVEFANANDQNARVFVQAVAKLIPLEITGKDGEHLTIRVVTHAAPRDEGRVIDLGPKEFVSSLGQITEH